MRMPPRRHDEFEVERSVYEMYPALRPLRGVANLAKQLIGRGT